MPTSRSSPPPDISGTESEIAAALGRLEGISPKGVLLAADFDGTLAPIVQEPQAARPDAQVLAHLRRLVPRLKRVAVVSGRDTALLTRALPVEGLTLVGNHGLEWADGGISRLVPQARAFAQPLSAARAQIARLAAGQVPGVELEAKLATLTVHFRRAADPDSTGRALEQPLRELAGRLGLRLHPGRLTWEVRPPIEIDKGAALLRLVREDAAQAAIYLGDDVSDQPAFEALKERSTLPSLAVGITSTEVPAAVFAACDLRLDGIPGVRAFLDRLLRWTELR